MVEEMDTTQELEACPASCYEYTCEYWTQGYSCAYLSSLGCDCGGCLSCHPTPAPEAQWILPSGKYCGYTLSGYIYSTVEEAQS